MKPITFRKITLILIGIMALSSLIVFLLQITTPEGIWHKDESKDQSNIQYKEEKSIPLDVQQRIQISSEVGSIQVFNTEDKEVSAFLNGSKEYYLKVDSSSSDIKIKIQRKNKKIIFNNDRGSSLKVLVPESYKGALEVTNDVGSIDIEGSYSDADIKTDVGSISVTLKTLDQGNFNFASDTGSITVNLPAEKNVTLEASTDVGSITQKSIFEHMVDTKEVVSSKISAISGEGKAKMDIVTDVGKILIQDFD